MAANASKTCFFRIVPEALTKKLITILHPFRVSCRRGCARRFSGSPTTPKRMPTISWSSSVPIWKKSSAPAAAPIPSSRTWSLRGRTERLRAYGPLREPPPDPNDYAAAFGKLEVFDASAVAAFAAPSGFNGPSPSGAAWLLENRDQPRRPRNRARSHRCPCDRAGTIRPPS